MKFSFKKIIGNTEYTFQDECGSSKDFFRKAAFFSGLPEKGPNGEDDLTVQFKTPGTYEYCQIDSIKAGMSYKFGEKKDGSGLFHKGWEKDEYVKPKDNKEELF